MERIQPPPNYYGAPYPNNAQENMGQNPYQPPMGGGYPNEPMNQPYPNQMPMNPPLRADTTPDVEEFYESFNKLVSSNLGRMVNVHCSFTDSTLWHDKEFIGVLASAGDNYIIVFDKETNRHYMIIGVYIDYIEFFDKITMDGVTSK